jgi:hypothetical protein
MRWFLLLLLYCYNPPLFAQSHNRGAIDVKVVDALNNHPISNAYISWSNTHQKYQRGIETWGSGRTDKIYGKVLLKNLVPSNEYELTVQAGSNFDPEIESHVKVKAGQTTLIIVYLHRTRESVDSSDEDDSNDDMDMNDELDDDTD